ncbi:MAG: ribbon-helix-helix protein, CopG family [Clostridia bacterium]|mgnify:CR=1 FL=1|jgi:predicted DNA-binding protein|nr:ribbon-helix-helix protein, CopG family [Clostridia bacterium]
MKEKLLLTRKNTGKRGDDGYKTFSVRMRSETVDELERLAARTDRSRNELICTLIEWALDNTEINE